MPDERLARLAARGSEAAFAAIFERHHQALHRYCHSIVGNGHDASDALQNTMLKAYRALAGETREITLKPWLYRIAHNESISLLRARRSDSDLDTAAHLGDPATDGLIESRDRLRTLAGDLTELTEQGRGALLMRELGGLQFAEIAAALGTSPAAAKQSVYESRCVLQALQEGREMDCDVVRRTLSDGDRRMLRGKKLRGHLRSCAGCQDFERALHERPTHLAALAPPLPLAAATAMLSGILGGAGAGGGFGAGGGLIAGLTGAAKGVAGVSLAKVATVAVVGTAIVGGGAVVVVPDRSSAPPERRAQPAGAAGAAAAGGTPAPAVVAAPRISAAHAPTRVADAALARAAASAASPASGQAAARGKSSTAPGRSQSPGNSAAGRARGRGPATTPGARRAERAANAPGRSAEKAATTRARSEAAARARAKATERARAEAKAKAVADALRARRATPAADAPGPGGAAPRARP
ncbi:MAG: sigma-70 family RNA polymerase sigma factor [Solirubrobacteraceae bacterium]|nr:sigma-70 family RNA polymerase sigma factor [Solirubrobacteraceae bacterium]